LKIGRATEKSMSDAMSPDAFKHGSEPANTKRTTLKNSANQPLLYIA